MAFHRRIYHSIGKYHYTGKIILDGKRYYIDECQYIGKCNYTGENIIPLANVCNYLDLSNLSD